MMLYLRLSLYKYSAESKGPAIGARKHQHQRGERQRSHQPESYGMHSNRRAATFANVMEFTPAMERAEAVIDRGERVGDDRDRSRTTGGGSLKANAIVVPSPVPTVSVLPYC